MAAAKSAIPVHGQIPPSERAETIASVLKGLNTWQDCVLKAQGLERDDKGDFAVSLLRAAERKFPESRHFLHKNLFEMMRRQRGED